MARATSLRVAVAPTSTERRGGRAEPQAAGDGGRTVSPLAPVRVSVLPAPMLGDGGWATPSSVHVGRPCPGAAACVSVRPRVVLRGGQLQGRGRTLRGRADAAACRVVDPRRRGRHRTPGRSPPRAAPGCRCPGQRDARAASRRRRREKLTRVVRAVDGHRRRQRRCAGEGGGARGLGDGDGVRAGGQRRARTSTAESPMAAAPLVTRNGPVATGAGERADGAGGDDRGGAGHAGDGEPGAARLGRRPGGHAGERRRRRGARGAPPGGLLGDRVRHEGLGRGLQRGEERVQALHRADQGLARGLVVGQLLLGQPLDLHQLADDLRGVQAGDEAVDGTHGGPLPWSLLRAGGRPRGEPGGPAPWTIRSSRSISRGA